MELAIPFAAALLYVAAVLLVIRMFFGLLDKRDQQHKQRETEYLKIIKDLHNRLTAKDLSGYMALKDVHEQHDITPRFDRSDEGEAMAERLRLGLTEVG